MNSHESGMNVTAMKIRFLLSALSLAMLCAAGCATMQTPATPPAPAAPQFSTPPPEIRTSILFSAVLLQIYHPETRTLYIWIGDPKPLKQQPMQCFKLQLSDTASGNPQRMPCD
jgi:hypothetical protein